MGNIITYKVHGDFNKTKKFLYGLDDFSLKKIAEKYGELGVKILRENTPKDSGLTADCWGYEITETEDSLTISWTNSNESDHVPIALLIQYGHATKDGGWVNGVDYINPSLKPIFNEIAITAWKEVTHK